MILIVTSAMGDPPTQFSTYWGKGVWKEHKASAEYLMPGDPTGLVADFSTDCSTTCFDLKKETIEVFYRIFGDPIPTDILFKDEPFFIDNEIGTFCQPYEHPPYPEDDEITHEICTDCFLGCNPLYRWPAYHMEDSKAEILTADGITNWDLPYYGPGLEAEEQRMLDFEDKITSCNALIYYGHGNPESFMLIPIAPVTLIVKRWEDYISSYSAFEGKPIISLSCYSMINLNDALKAGAKEAIGFYFPLGVMIATDLEPEGFMSIFEDLPTDFIVSGDLKDAYDRCKVSLERSFDKWYDLFHAATTQTDFANSFMYAGILYNDWKALSYANTPISEKRIFCNFREALRSWDFLVFTYPDRYDTEVIDPLGNIRPDLIREGASPNSWIVETDFRRKYKGTYTVRLKDYPDITDTITVTTTDFVGITDLEFKFDGKNFEGAYYIENNKWEEVSFFTGFGDVRLWDPQSGEVAGLFSKPMTLAPRSDKAVEIPKIEVPVLPVEVQTLHPRYSTWYTWTTLTPTVTPTATATPTATPTPTPTPTATPPPNIITCIFPRLSTGNATPRISTSDPIPRISCLQKLL